ncbi:hypothetical protein ACRAVF_25045 [Bradyrhizobium oligotrophicum S58]
MSDFENRKSSNGFTSKLWRGERMTMIGFDVVEPEPDLVGFSIEVKSPGARDFSQLRNRIAFSYPAGAGAAVDGNRNFPSTEAPFQKFRWIHFPYRPKDGVYTYRVAKQHMRNDGTLVAGTSLTLDVTQSAVTYDGLVDVGFTRNFASSQAYRDQFGNNAEIIPVESRDAPGFDKLDLTNEAGDSVYEWLGFEAYDLLFGFLKEALADPGLTLDVMAYDLNEPDVIGQLEQFGPRLRAIIDDSNAKDNSHKLPGSAGVAQRHGEKGNGDHLIMIEDRKIATSYAIEAARVFDHLQFRNRMRDAFHGKSERQRAASAPAAITLRKPTALSGKPAWFERFYVESSQAERDRLLFSS